MEMLFRKSASNIGNNKNSFSGISNSVDNNIKNRRDINYKLHTLYKDLDDIELQLYRISDFLADTRKSYLGAEERIQMYKNSAEINRHKKVQQPDKKEENFFARIGNSFSSGIEHIKNFFSNSSDEKNNNSVLDYLERSAKQVIMGNYTDEVTVWGTGMQLCLGLTGADIVMDIRDIVYDFHKWEWSFEHVGQTGFDVLSVVPLIGALKYGDEVVDLVKGVDKTSDVVKNVDRTTDVIKGTSKAIEKLDVDYFNKLIKNGEIKGNNIIGKIDDNTQIVFRQDTGVNAHKMTTRGYPEVVDHYNIEVQTLTPAGKWKSKFSYHIILDELGNIIDSF